MGQAPAYNRSGDFSDDELNNVGGRSTVLTAAVDAELDAVAVSINALRDNLFIIQRDDGALRDGIVRLSSLSQEVLNLMVTEGDAVPRGAWVTATAYAKKDIVTQGGSTYMAVTAHTSGVFATDLAAFRWVLIANPAQIASTVPFTPAGSIAATNVQAAIEESDSENRTLSTAAAAAVSTLIADLANSANAAKGPALVGMGSLPGIVYPSGAGKAIQDLQRGAFLSVTSYGTVGTADDTAVFQAAMTAAAAAKRTLLVPPGTYTVTPLSVPSNLTMYMEAGVLIKAKTGYGINERLLNINGVSNVTIHGNGATIQMLKAEYVGGEQRHGVFIINSTDVRIYDLNSIDTGGDCFYIGRDVAGGTHSQRVSLINCRGVNARRQGLSIVSGDTINIVNCSFESTTGTPPAYGVDIEPNDSLDVVRAIHITNLKTSGNFGGGLLVALQALGATAANEVSIYVNGWTSDGDGANSPNNANAGLRVTGNGTGAWAFPIRGLVKISNFLIRNPKSSGIWCTYWQATNTPTLVIEDGVVINPGSSSPANDEDKCGLVIWGYNLGAQDFGNIEVNRVKVRDTRGVAATYSPVYAFKTAGATGVGQARSVKLHDVMGEGFTPLSGRGHVLAIVDMDQSSITYSLEQVVNNIANSADVTRGYAGYTITCTVSGVNTLPKASTNRGLSYKFLDLVTNQTLQVRPTAGDTLDGCGTIANKDMVLSVYSACAVYTATDQPADFYRLDFANPLSNRPLLCGEITRPPTNKVYVTAMPTTGTWGQGDEAWLFQKTAGAPYFWFRLTTGAGNVLGVDWKASPNL